ncbi:Clr6 histone deacetylase associated PHD protein-2 Cph2 [Vermiconidia calcicola]|uniref:Clr6 histone deacetylase associated PHD protein-2 Cph2 n=1 Tax=Vermiconidia calcicola TaxID=1690605 RepID=A0ACC3NFV4_9PEZI|nr:Clr6 histone deacetylase associated PHD protein-2 Cph2 [Vermiconidia calcicola]
MDRGGWQSGFPLQSTAYGPPFGDAQNHEDWEDWLRWDPAADVTSPENGTFHSGSSKNDSPIQDTLLPVEDELFAKPNETLAPPLIMGEDAFDFGGQTVPGDETFLFGNPQEDTANFDFQPMVGMEQTRAGVPKMDTNATTWTLPTTTDSQNIDLSALTNEGYLGIPIAGTTSSSAPSLHYSPESSSQVANSISSNSPDPPKKRGGRKRKADSEQEQREQNGENSQEDGDGPPVKKTSHNVIEKRYRNNLNDKIVELRNSVPSLRAQGKPNGSDDTENLEGLTPAHKLNKATVMAKATEYIKHLEKRNKTMADEMAALKARLAAVEAAIGKNQDRQASMSNSPPSGSMRPRETSSSSQNGAPGFLNVPLNQPVMQQQYMQPQAQPAYARQPNPPVEAQNHPQHANARGRGGVLNKVMLGSMAGIMMMEGYSEQQQAPGGTETHGLAALPLHLLKRGLDTPLPSSAAAFSRQAALPLLKIFLVVGALMYILAPLFTFSPRRKQKTRATTVRLPHAPSLASPIEVRRKAWQTAIQTVWVPKHFLLEVVAVTVKMISLSLRRLIGSEAYNSLTGANKEDEIARIKAWDIAIDAQLAGGDQEVSYYRLLLTLMESGTLPDSPLRLMQKAVHFRVFFWEVANAGYGNMVCFKQFTEKVGKIYWDNARRQQKELMHAKAQGRPSHECEDEVDLLPDHLASLVELDCDDVLSDEMVQRAWNLAWNKPSAHRTVANAARDAVIEDHAIRSPLDAVAAWYANMTIDDTLAESLCPHASTLDTEYYAGLAVMIAPPASGTLVRALATKAVLSNSNREANIIAALEALPTMAPSSGEMNVVSHIPATPDVRTALTLAKLLTLTHPTAPSVARTRALYAVAGLHIPPASFTLLTAVASFRLLKALTNSTKYVYSMDVTHGLEDLAASLRVWVGTSAGRAAGMGKEECVQVVELCLGVAKQVGGWEERDSGYGSASAGSSPVRASVELFHDALTA